MVNDILRTGFFGLPRGALLGDVGVRRPTESRNFSEKSKFRAQRGSFANAAAGEEEGEGREREREEETASASPHRRPPNPTQNFYHWSWVIGWSVPLVGRRAAAAGRHLADQPNFFGTSFCRGNTALTGHVW